MSQQNATSSSGTSKEHDTKIKKLLQELHFAVCDAQTERNVSGKTLDNIAKAHEKIESENKCE